MLNISQITTNGELFSTIGAVGRGSCSFLFIKLLGRYVYNGQLIRFSKKRENITGKRIQNIN